MPSELRHIVVAMTAAAATLNYHPWLFPSPSVASTMLACRIIAARAIHVLVWLDGCSSKDCNGGNDDDDDEVLLLLLGVSAFTAARRG